METYEITKTDTEEFVTVTTTIEKKEVFQKDWLVAEIARLQKFLSEYEKGNI